MGDKRQELRHRAPSPLQRPALSDVGTCWDLLVAFHAASKTPFVDDLARSCSTRAVPRAIVPCCQTRGPETRRVGFRCLADWGCASLGAPLRLSCGASSPPSPLTHSAAHRLPEAPWLGRPRSCASGAYSWDASAAGATAAGRAPQLPHIPRYRMPNRRTATSPPHHHVCCPRKRVRVIPVRRLLLATACRRLPEEAMHVRGNLFLALDPAGRLFHLSIASQAHVTLGILPW